MLDYLIGRIFVSLMIVWAGWIVLCWLTPILFLMKRVKIPDSLLPKLPLHVDLAIQSRRIRVIYVDDLRSAPDRYGYAVSCWLGWRRAILVNSTFAQFATQAGKQFVLAHELGHHVLGHVTARMVLYMLLLHRLPPVRQWLQMSEHHADRYAEQITGHPPSVAWGPVVMKDVDEARLREACGVTAFNRGTPTDEEKA